MIKSFARTTLMALALVLLLVLPAPMRAQEHGNVLRVGAGGDYATLTEALTLARPGTTIEILPGVQTGQWTLDVSIRLTGQPGAVLDGAGKGTLLTIMAAGVTIAGLTIRHTGSSLLDDDAAIRIKASDARILNNQLIDIQHAIYVMDGAARTVISGNHIQGRAERIPEDRGNGIHLWNAPDSRVENNTVADVRDGVYVGFAPRSSFRDNAFKRLRYGIHFMYADDNLFEGNTFEQSEAGAALMYSKHITLRRNLFAHSRSNRAYGLLLQECDDVLAEDNSFIDNSRALFVNVTRGSRFRNNLFAANDLAVQIYAGATDNTFERNDFVANMHLIELDQPGSNHWSGNYWEEYRGMDLNDDGYGDTPFSTGDPLGTLITDHPQLRLFRYSPAVQALEAGERAFPVIELPAIIDTSPALRPVAQVSGRLPPLPDAPVGTPLSLLLASMAGALAGLMIAWRGRRIMVRGDGGRRTDDGIHPPSSVLRLPSNPATHDGRTTRLGASND
jgi:nitrous oxidase accessory protein